MLIVFVVYQPARPQYRITPESSARGKKYFCAKTNRLAPKKKTKGRREAGLAFCSGANALVLRGSRAAPTEAVVQAGLDRVLVVVESGPHDLGGTAGKGAAAEIIILVFHFGGPVLGEHI